MEKQALITKDTLLPLGLVFTLVGAAISFGIMYSKVETMSQDVALIKAQQNENTKLLNQLVGRQSISKQ